MSRSLPSPLSTLIRVIERVQRHRVTKAVTNAVPLATMNSHVGYGLPYPYNYLNTGVLSPGAPIFQNTGGGYSYRPDFRQPPYHFYHGNHHHQHQGNHHNHHHRSRHNCNNNNNNKAQAFAASALWQQYLLNFHFTDCDHFHPSTPQKQQIRSTHRSAGRVRRSVSSSDIQEEILKLKVSAKKLTIRGGSVESVTTISSGSEGSDENKSGEESPDSEGSITGDLDSGLGDEPEITCTDEDEYDDDEEDDMEHPRGVKRQPDQRGRSPIQKRPRSEERESLNKGPWNVSPGLLTQEEYQKLSDRILDYYEKQEQAQDLYVKKMKLRDALYAVMRGVFPYCGLYVVGSSMNGFGSHTSDMDLCLMISYSEIDQRKEATEILRMLHRSLKKCNFLKEINLICAKVPILKFRDKISDVECDLNINNSVGIRNTHLLNAYSKLDWRVSCLVLFVKNWAKLQNINDASQGTISSYSLVLMVIHYLQCGCTPPVVPSLQTKYPHKFSASIDIRQLTLNEKLPPYQSPNKQSLGELFMGFLHYYAEKFNFHEDAISVRLGRRMPRECAIKQSSLVNPPSQWKCLCIEEPFNLSNTARSVFDPVVFSQIRVVIQRSYAKLRQTGDVSNILDRPLL